MSVRIDVFHFTNELVEMRDGTTKHQVLKLHDVTVTSKKSAKLYNCW